MSLYICLDVIRLPACENTWSVRVFRMLEDCSAQKEQSEIGYQKSTTLECNVGVVAAETEELKAKVHGLEAYLTSAQLPWSSATTSPDASTTGTNFGHRTRTEPLHHLELGQPACMSHKQLCLGALWGGMW